MTDFDVLKKNIISNNMNCSVCENKAEVLSLVKEILPIGSKVSSGGSMSLLESGVLSLIKSENYTYLDRNKEGLSESEKEDVFKEILNCDYYFASANALTQKGEVINVDGFSNRISSLCFGPKNVVLVVGKNKIVKDTKEGFLRVKKIAAPKNAVRLGLNTPCAKLGHCVSLEKNDSPDICDGCNSANRICCSYEILAKQRIKNRVHIILCKEDLGY